MKTLLRGIFLSIIILTLQIQNAFCIELSFKNYSVESGLLSNTVYTIIQDSKGFIWIGTEDGLNCFNGYEFQNYRNKPRDNSSLINNHVYCLYEDSEQKIWIGTEEGVCIYDPKTDLFTPFTLQANDNTTITGRVQSIIVNEKGNIWISVYGQGVFKYDSFNKSLKRYTFKKYANENCLDDLVTYLYRDRLNNIWVSVNSTNYQIFKLENNAAEFIPAYPNIKPDILAKLSAYAMIEDTFGTLWFGTWTEGLCTVNPTTGVIDSYLNVENKDKILHIHTITEYEPGKLLIGSDDGLTVFSVSPTLGNKLDIHLKEPALSSRFVYPIFKDREGGLWIGTYYGGINYASPNRNYFTSYIHDKHQNSISGYVMSVFCEDALGNLWIGTDDNGLNYYNTKTNKFTLYKPERYKNSLSYHNIHGLCIDDNYLWVGTYMGGLNRMDVNTKVFKHYYANSSDTTSLYSNSVYAIYKDSHSNIWVGATIGINLYNREKDNFIRMKRTGMVIDIIQVKDIVWFATLGEGLYTYDLKTKSWNNYQFNSKDEQSLNSNDITCLASDENGRLWIGTNNGICFYDENSNSFKNVPINMQSQSIRNIFCYNESLWITTAKGLVCFETTTKKTRLFTENDGLLSDEFTLKSGIKSSSGRIYIGTAKGFNAFYPKQIEINRYVPPIELSNFQLFNQSVDIKEYMSTDDGVQEIILPYNKNAFSFEYTALSYYASEKNEYAFILENFDKKWSYVGNQRKATYTNIPPGEYYFKVKASNNDGIWNSTGLSIRVVVKPPIWLTYWALAIYVLIVIFSFVMIIRYIKKRDEKKHNERIEKIKSEKEKEAYDSKINFFTTIAHEIRTPVSLIIGPLEKILESSEELPDKTIRDLSIIDRNSQRLLFLTNQLLDFRKIEREAVQITLSTVNVNDLLMSIYTRFRLFVEQKNISFFYTCDNEKFEARIDPENLTKVISNLLNNASKFTKDFIELSLITNTKTNSFQIHVTDNGEGIAWEQQEKIFTPFYQVQGTNKPGTGLGLYLVKSIIDAFKGTIKIDSILGEGTTFSLTIPNSIEEPKSEIKSDLSSSLKLQDNIGSTETKDFFARENTIYQTVEDEEKPILLIVEDNIDLQSFLSSSLSDTYSILQAGDGEQGLRILEKSVVDIIISDIMMPNMDGIEFCNQVKKNFLWNHIPIILLTAKTNLSSKIEALETGADAYIEKPFSVSHISAQIKNLLDSRKNLLNKFAETPFATLKSIAGNKADEEFLSKVNELIEKNISNINFSVEDMAKELGISSSGLFAKIKNLSGITPNKLLLLIRLKKAAELLNENKYRVNEVCYMVGFNNPSYFAKCFYKQFNIHPKELLNTSSTD